MNAPSRMSHSATPRASAPCRSASHAYILSAPISRRSALAAVALAGASVPLAGCAGAGGDAASGPFGSAAANDGIDASRQVIIAMNPTSEPAAGFDPLVSWGCGEHVHEPLIQSTLVTTDANLAFHGDLATDYECSDDGLTWTFSLRDDVRFTDGEPLTAEDVAFTVNSAVASPSFEADLSWWRRRSP